MPRHVRPSLRRISTLDTIEEASSTDTVDQSSVRRLSKEFSVNAPVNARPQRRLSEIENDAKLDLPLKVPVQQPTLRRRQSEARESLLDQRRSMVRRASARFRRSICAIPSKQEERPQKRSKVGSDQYVPSYARPTAASIAKAARTK